MPDIDQFIPPALRLFVTAAAICLAFYVLYRSTTSKTWKDERDAAVTQAERLKKENAEKDLELATLRARTDLEGLARANQEEHQLIVATLSAVQVALTAVHAGLQDISQRLNKG